MQAFINPPHKSLKNPYPRAWALAAGVSDLLREGAAFAAPLKLPWQRACQTMCGSARPPFQLLSSMTRLNVAGFRHQVRESEGHGERRPLPEYAISPEADRTLVMRRMPSVIQPPTPALNRKCGKGRRLPCGRACLRGQQGHTKRRHLRSRHRPCCLPPTHPSRPTSQLFAGRR
jgi:hypothetical protein